MDPRLHLSSLCITVAAALWACSGDSLRKHADPARGAAGSTSDPFGNASAPDATSGSIPNAPASSSSPIFDTSDGGDECGRQDFDLARRPADILLVLDRSGSMQDDVNGDSKDPSKWDLVVPALQQVITATNDSVAWGLKLFPEGDKAGECTDESYPRSIAVDVKPDNAETVNGAISATGPNGDGTPTGDAIDEAVKYLKTLHDDNPKYILLATDGEPSCAGSKKGSSDARPAAVDAVGHAADAGFHTFVVGIATTKSSAQATLGELAKKGLEAPAGMSYYLATTKDQLVSALQAIAGSVATCSFPLRTKPPDPDHVGVFLGSERIAKDGASHDGWNYTDAERSAIELFGPACESLMKNGSGSVRVVFGCRSDPVF